MAVEGNMNPGSCDDMQDITNSLEEQDKLNKEIKVDQRAIIDALKDLFAMKHGRTYTGRELVDADGAPIAAKRPAGSEEEEEEEGE
jgi:hypothetical protein